MHELYERAIVDRLPAAQRSEYLQDDLFHVARFYRMGTSRTPGGRAANVKNPWGYFTCGGA